MVSRLGATLPRIKSGQRFFVAGPTGSGKTELTLQQLLKPLPLRIIVIDPKREFEWDCADPRFEEPVTSVSELGALLVADERAGKKQRAYIVRPPSSDFTAANIHKVDQVFDWAMTLGDTCVYTDEMYTLCGGSSSHRETQERLPNWVRAVTQGRSSRVTIGGAAQRPSNIPLIALTESDIRATFYLRDPRDQDRMDDYCGAVPWDELAQNDYSFVWATDKDQSLPIRLALKPSLKTA